MPSEIRNVWKMVGGDIVRIKKLYLSQAEFLRQIKTVDAFGHSIQPQDNSDKNQFCKSACKALALCISNAKKPFTTIP
jgi:HJR/Mrr/RecB family endonuclease